MGLLGKNYDKDIQYLHDERGQMWERIVNIELLIDELEKRTPEVEKEAKQALRKTSEYRNKALAGKEKIDHVLEELDEALNKADDALLFINNKHEQSGQITTLITEKQAAIDETFTQLEDQIQRVQSQIDLLDNVLKEHPDLQSEIVELLESLSEIKEHQSKITNIYKESIDKHSEIKAIYNEIEGFEEIDAETNEEVYVAGLKDTLENQYSDLIKIYHRVDNSLDALHEKSYKTYQETLSIANNKTQEVIDSWTENYENLKEQITNLLPGALTAGLGAAYTNKKEEEQESFKKLNRSFNLGILGLILVSLIPFLVSVYYFNQGNTLEQIIDRIPKLVTAILPLYLPVLWLAFSSNIKVKLSKRLIEEYTHKEVLSKTYEGLASQIETIDNKELSKELKMELLHNILQISSENPGKLISNYDKSDHPILEVLNQSSKLATQIHKVGKLPGMSKLAKVLVDKQEKLLSEEDIKVKQGLEHIDKHKEKKKTNSKEELEQAED